MTYVVSTRFSIPADLTCIKAARNHIVRMVADWNGLDVTALGDLRSVASELLANGVEHARGTPLTIRLRQRDRRLLLEVFDGSPDAPRPRCVPAGAERGRGLVVIAALAEEWGWEPIGAGKRVWVTMKLPEPDDSPGVSGEDALLPRRTGTRLPMKLVPGMGRYGRSEPVEDEQTEDFRARHLAPVAAAVLFTLYATVLHPGALTMRRPGRERRRSRSRPTRMHRRLAGRGPDELWLAAMVAAARAWAGYRGVGEASR
ncbi:MULTISPECIES: ATP-binding protein [Streptomycetaceae]|uniref:Histidine kinase/HSP90-like ATPase domain-containing protein n=1 Tax=Streptantibioticus cattleyicolor (strain ATCC 35852 / DSM 46488 / JCM 4925 / NBRC 14057 / NRRL 8057) TaxID=1003195 RepID=F8JX09_STREN|nr:MULTISPECIES: ATP-binding protein [Streptomycetaceae]AEW93278.1 hypothetical protein SCATT_09070 [Streptantibioticus cattleyicolor NRRL 8057 = DSM 46488]MYS57998.1 ATP-binding protein [Streptomyces sp. SID5468]CCB73639.1 protein of unknown function [Streptantibioticus cattleyicolor NRRL 8057 = DSM 46488]